MSTLREGDHTYLVSYCSSCSMMLSTVHACRLVLPSGTTKKGVVASVFLCVYYSYVDFDTCRG